MVETAQGKTEGKPAAGRGARRLDPALVGRRVALALYAVLAVWVMGSGLVSVVPQIFWPHSGVIRPTADCTLEIDALLTSLEDTVTVRPELARRERFAAWDERYLSLAGSCETRPGYAQLYRARYAAETAAARHDDQLAPLLDEVRARARASGDRR